MKNQALFSYKNKCEKLKCRLLQFLFGALRVKLVENIAAEFQIRRSFEDNPKMIFLIS